MSPETKQLPTLDEIRDLAAREDPDMAYVEPPRRRPSQILFEHRDALRLLFEERGLNQPSLYKTAVADDVDDAQILFVAEALCDMDYREMRSFQRELEKLIGISAHVLALHPWPDDIADAVVAI